MSLLSPRLTLRVAQKQILTPGLVQMVTVLQLNRLELKDMIAQEIAENPVLEESADVEELTQEEVQALLERERGEPADASILETVSDAVNGTGDAEVAEAAAEYSQADTGPGPEAEPAKTEADSCDQRAVC